MFFGTAAGFGLDVVYIGALVGDLSLVTTIPAAGRIGGSEYLLAIPVEDAELKFPDVHPGLQPVTIVQSIPVGCKRIGHVAGQTGSRVHIYSYGIDAATT